MAVSVWPANLPQLLQVDGYSEGVSDGRIRTQMDVGPAKVRRRTSATPRALTGTMFMTGQQIAQARAFVENTLLDGALPFRFPDPLTGAPLLVRISETAPSWASAGGLYYRWSMALEVLPT